MAEENTFQFFGSGPSLESPRERSFLDYATDVPVGVAKGLSQATKGLLQLGAMPIDYIGNTDLINKIDEIWPTIQTDTALGDITSVITQFGVPATGAIKIANGLMKLNKASQMKKLSSIPSLSGKGAELAKRAGFYGSIGGITDFAVSTPGDMKTLSETLGYGEDYKGGELRGRERVVEDFKEKIKFGAEGAVLGGGITAALPVAGTLGVKFGLMAAKPVGYVGGQALRALDFTVFNPVGKLFGTETAGTATRFVGEKIDKGLTKLGEKLGTGKFDDWKYLSANKNAPLRDRLRNKLYYIQKMFQSDGVMGPEVGGLLRKSEDLRQANEKTLIRLMDDVDAKFKDIANNYTIKLPKYFEGTNIKPITAVDDVMRDKNSQTMFQYLQAPKKLNPAQLKAGELDEAILLSRLPKEVHGPAKEIKEIIRTLGKEYGQLLQQSPLKAVREFGTQIMTNGDVYLKQVYSAMKNKAYKFDPTKIKGAKNFYINNIIKKNADLQEEVADLAKVKGISQEQALEEFADAQMKQVQKSLIQSNRAPDTVFNQIAKTFRIPTTALRDDAGNLIKDEAGNVITKQERVLQAGEDVRNLIAKQMGDDFSPVTKAFLEPAQDYRAAVTDTFMQMGQQIYKKRFFDELAKTGLRSGLFFKSPTQAVALGKNTDNLVHVKPSYGQYNEMFQSPLFTSGKSLDGGVDGLMTTPEIANAIRGVDNQLSTLYSLPLYKALMSVKAAGQIGKTVFSPMTQIRNVSTASFFALASGLIGGKVSLGTAFKLLADDLFPRAGGRRIKVEEVARQMSDRIRRGVVDQNIEVNEIKNILNRAKDGKLSMSGLMDNPVVKKAFDLYQGGDNVWKIYADDFYQDALGSAFKFNPKNLSQDAALKENLNEWFTTVAKTGPVFDNAGNALRPDLFSGGYMNADELLKDASAYLVTNTIPTYSKVPEIIKVIRNLPLGNFIAFPAEILRTGGHLLTIGARELTSTNPFIRQMGARRLLGTSAVFGGVGKIIQETAEGLTGVDQETMDAFQRSFGPEYQKNSTLIPLTSPDAKGQFKYFNFSYTNPYDSLVRPVNAVLNAVGDGTLTKESADRIAFQALFGDTGPGGTGNPGALSEFLQPFISESIGAEALIDISPVLGRGGETREGRKVYFDSDSALKKIDSSLAHVFKSLEPGATRSARRVWKGVTQDFTDYGTMYDSKTEAAALLTGLRVEQAKPLVSMPFIITSFGKDQRDLGARFARDAYSATTTSEQKLAAYKNFLIDSYENQSLMHQVIKDARTMNVPGNDIRNVLQTRLKNKKQTNELINGFFRAPGYSEERFNALVERIRSESPIAAVEQQIQINNLTSQMDILRTSMNNTKLVDRPYFENLLNLFISPATTSTRIFDEIELGRGTGIEQVAELDPAQEIGTPVSGQVVQQSAQVNQPTLSLGEKFNILFR